MADDDQRNISQAGLAQLRRQHQLCSAAHPGANIGLHYFTRRGPHVPSAILHCDGPTDHANGLWVIEQYESHVEARRLEEALDLLLFQIEELSTEHQVGYVSRQDFLLLRGENPVVADFANINCWHQFVDDSSDDEATT